MKENTDTAEFSIDQELPRKAVLKHDHFLLDNSINEETRSQFLSKVGQTRAFNKTMQEETEAKVYDEYSNDKILFSEEQIYTFKPVYESVLPTSMHYNFNSLQKWEGVVTEVHEDNFFARLTDLTQGGSDEIIELAFDDVSSDDRELIEKGAIFYWNIGYETINGQDRKTSLIRFRRLPKWTKKKVESMREKGKEFMSKIQWK